MLTKQFSRDYRNNTETLYYVEITEVNLIVEIAKYSYKTISINKIFCYFSINNQYPIPNYLKGCFKSIVKGVILGLSPLPPLAKGGLGGS